MNAKTWFYAQSFNGSEIRGETEVKTVTVGEYANVPQEHHVHYCVTCDKDYPCTSVHRRIDGTPDTPPRATRRCPECAPVLGVLTMSNNNQALIEGLRQAADFLESKPDFPVMGKQTIELRVWDDKPKLREAARQLGSFTKRFTEYYFEIAKAMNEWVEIQVYTDRDQVCKKKIVWECPDDESLLKIITEEPAAERCAEVGRGE